MERALFILFLFVVLVIYLVVANHKDVSISPEERELIIKTIKHINKYKHHQTSESIIRKIYKECVIREEEDVYLMVERHYIACQCQLSHANSIEIIIHEYNLGRKPKEPRSAVELYKQWRNI